MMKLYSGAMKNAMPFPKLLRRTLTSLAAIAAVSVIFGAKALENEHEGKEAAQIAMAHDGAAKTATP